METSDCLLKNLLVLNYLFAGASTAPAGFLLQGMPPQEITGRILRDDWLGKRQALTEAAKRFDPERELAACRGMGIKLLCLTDAAFPFSLRHIPDPPLVLYMKGDLQERDTNSFAIVGSRHATFYGITQARKFAVELASSGLTIVSGLALGIDRAAHEGALQARGGRTLAVLGCGLDRIYPAKNRDLHERIPEKGAILSEFPLGTEPLAHHFPSRNRIISGLSLGTLVVEAHTRSGSLITASRALDQGREVFALPGRVDQLTSRGTHALIKQGAILADSSLDILQTLATGFSFSPPLPGDEDARKLETAADDDDGDRDPVRAALLGGAGSFEEILAASGMPAGRLMSDLITREIKGEIMRTPQGRYSLKPE